MNWDITVCIPSIPPRHLLLQRAVASVLRQTLPASAISIAIDNDKLGAGATRNRALFASTTRWVAFMDDDDELYPFHLEALAAHAEATGADVVFPWFDTDPAGCDPFPALEGLEHDPAAPHIFPITTLVRAELAKRVGGFPENFQASPVCAGEDWEFWVALLNAGAVIKHLHRRTWVWHHDSGNTSGLPSRW